MIDTKNCAKDEVKEADWQDSLPETDKMETERNTTEGTIAFNSAENLLACRFGLLNRQEWRLHAIEHTRIDK